MVGPSGTSGTRLGNLGPVPLYEYRCLDCDTVFEQRRPMAEADTGIVCPDGHARTKRLLAMFASSRSGSSPSMSSAMAPAPSGGGCGSSCGCH